MRIIVTGSAGRLGSVTVNKLREIGHTVAGVDLVQSKTTDYILDIRDYSSVLSF